MVAKFHPLLQTLEVKRKVEGEVMDGKGEERYRESTTTGWWKIYSPQVDISLPAGSLLHHLVHTHTYTWCGGESNTV